VVGARGLVGDLLGCLLSQEWCSCIPRGCVHVGRCRACRLEGVLSRSHLPSNGTIAMAPAALAQQHK
jgi:hypothetical protein